jgi:hypothetical protein
MARDYASLMKSSCGGTSPETIDAFQSRHGVELPAAYREFLRQTNGGKPMLAEFKIESWGSSRVTTFYGIGDTASGNLDRFVESQRDSIEAELIPIACDPGGNVIAIRVAGNLAGSVEFVPHDFVDAVEETEFFVSYPIARDFDTFLGSLKPDGAFD